MTRPGHRLRAFAAAWCDDRTLRLVIDPAIADLQREQTMFAYVPVLNVLLACLMEEAMMTAPGWTPDERRILRRAGAATALVTLLVVLGLEQPFVPYAWKAGPLDYRVPLYLAPQDFRSRSR